MGTDSADELVYRIHTASERLKCASAEWSEVEIRSRLTTTLHHGLDFVDFDSRQLWRTAKEVKGWLVDALIDARVLVASNQDGRRVVEIAHEAFLRRWRRLTATLDEARNDLRLRTALSQAAREWDAGGRNPIYLWPMGRGDMVAEAMTRLQVRLTDVEQAFLQRVCEKAAAKGSVFISYAREDKYRAEEFARARAARIELLIALMEQ